MDDVKTARGSATVWQIAERLVGGVRADGHGASPGDWNQALMELGATVCTPRAPACESCPAHAHCLARARGIAGDLPRVAPKRSPRAIRRVAVVLASSRAVLLARRRRDVLFGGLWEPPGLDGKLAALAAALGVDPTGLQAAGDVVHVLSHRRLEVRVSTGALRARRHAVPWQLPGPDYDAIEPVSLSELSSIPHSTLARKILTVAKVPGVGLRSKPRVNE
jgi:A/G-specific adenine glycosylase